MPGRIAYYLLLPVIYLIAALPFRALYALSDFFYLILYRIAGYRKEVVLANLHRSFPEKTEAEIRSISRGFYHHLCDLFLETFKTLTFSRSAALKRCIMSPEAQALFDRLADEHQNIILAMAHQGNWEWFGNTFSIQCRQRLLAIYHPLRNPGFDGLLLRMRSRFGAKLIPMADSYRGMAAEKPNLNATAFIADQAPSPGGAYWTNFLNQDTPVFRGMERIAKKMNYPVVYIQVRKIKRGYYEILATMLEETPKNAPDGSILEAYTRKLEQDIIAQPETWLWSHRRWKHTRPPQA